MKKPKRTSSTEQAPRIRKNRKVAVLVIGVAVIASVIVFGARKSESKSVQTPPALATQPYVQSLGWETGDFIYTRRVIFERAVGNNGWPEWPLYTREYFLELKARRDAVIAWAASQPVKPKIDFIGAVHVNMGGGNTPEMMKEIEAIALRSYETLVRQSRGASVIAIEEHGTNEILTPEVFAEHSVNVMKTLLGIKITKVQAYEMMRKERASGVRAIVELKEPPVICGEEWPIGLETRVLQSHAEGDVANLMIGAFNILRSEIIMIRTLEFMRRVNGTRGVILQGEAHGRDVEHFAPEYHVDVQRFSP